ncbi:MAG: VanZ family protein [Oscillospiraceae bacterium]|nr:VanZ family protein [Oscillospiraceae bacterium]
MPRSRVSIAVTILLWLLVLATMAQIFRFSSEDAKKSTETSGKVVRTVAEVVVPSYKKMTPKEQDSFVESVMNTVRKAAHFTIFACLGLWLWLLISRYRKNYILPFAVGISALYACTDELHQTFVSGRSGRIKDVLIDTSGAFTGALAALILFLIWQKLKNKVAKRP